MNKMILLSALAVAIVSGNNVFGQEAPSPREKLLAEAKELLKAPECAACKQKLEDICKQYPQLSKPKEPDALDKALDRVCSALESAGSSGGRFGASPVVPRPHRP